MKFTLFSVFFYNYAPKFEYQMKIFGFLMNMPCQHVLNALFNKIKL